MNEVFLGKYARSVGAGVDFREVRKSYVRENMLLTHRGVPKFRHLGIASFGLLEMPCGGGGRLGRVKERQLGIRPEF